MMGGAMDEAKPTEAAGGDHAGMGDMAMGGGANSAAYMTIRNTGSAPDKLIKAGGDVAGSIELHTMIEENGMMQMRPVEGGIEIPAGGEVQLKPGGFHVMLIGITRDLKQGEMVKLTLEFEKAGSVTIDAPVQMP
jgi:copper(I)-binding protein